MRHKESSEAPVAMEIGVYGFKLNVKESHSHKWRQTRSVMNVLLERAEKIRK